MFIALVKGSPITKKTCGISGIRADGQALKTRRLPGAAVGLRGFGVRDGHGWLVLSLIHCVESALVNYRQTKDSKIFRPRVYSITPG